ncbi:MAG: sugar phosphate isomerase/epimerase family protein [Planctomycetaceae bacterium]
MRLGYNTNGLAFHRWPDSIDLLIEAGYSSVAITLDHHCLNPFQNERALKEEIQVVREKLAAAKMISVIETGARFLLDPRQKHEPTLITADADQRQRRIDFLCRAVDIADQLGSSAVSFWAGVPSFEASESGLAEAWLIEGCQQVTNYAEARNVLVAFEPEPGMLIESFDQFQHLKAAIPSPAFGLTVDIGHVQCVEAKPIADYLLHWGDLIYNIHIEDMVRGVHEHLRFGEGEIDFVPVLKTLDDVGFTGGLNIELSRHSHMAPEVVTESFEFLNRIAIEAGINLA